MGFRLALVALLASTTAVAAQESAVSPLDLTAADSLVTAWVDAEAVAGAVFLVVRSGEIVHHRAYGWGRLFDYGQGQYSDADEGEAAGGILRRRTPTPMTTGTVFDLASVTKVMATTFAVMLLVDDGALELDAPVYRYLPDFRGPEKDAITVRHLLTHSAGLQQWVPTYYHAADADDAYDHVRDLPLGWAVGQGRHYSDLGFMLLGRVVEAVAGRPLPDLLHERLYGPLGLSATGYRPTSGGGPSGPFAATSHGNPFEHRMVHDTTFGYRIEGDAGGWDGWRRRTLEGEVNDGNAHHAFGGVAGHAGLFSTAEELGTLLQLLLTGGVHTGGRYLSADIVSAFLTPQLAGQALGWQLPAYAPEGSFTHTGFTGTWVLGVPEVELAVVLLTNRQNVGVDHETRYTDLGPLQRAVAAALLGVGSTGG